MGFSCCLVSARGHHSNSGSASSLYGVRVLKAPSWDFLVSKIKFPGTSVTMNHLNTENK
jgi:hypothetical protein